MGRELISDRFCSKLSRHHEPRKFGRESVLGPSPIEPQGKKNPSQIQKGPKEWQRISLIYEGKMKMTSKQMEELLDEVFRKVFGEDW